MSAGRYQVATGDSWASGVARPIVFQYDDQDGRLHIDTVAYAYFVIYTVVASVFLLNVVIAGLYTL
jgi:hypothetical protein